MKGFDKTAGILNLVDDNTLNITIPLTRYFSYSRTACLSFYYAC